MVAFRPGPPLGRPPAFEKYGSPPAAIPPWTNPPLPQLQTYALDVNWNGDGSTFVDETTNFNLLSLQSKRGHDWSSQLTGRAIAGSLQAEFLNIDGRFSPSNPASPLYGNLLPARKVRWRATAPYAGDLWTGFTYSGADPHSASIPTASLPCVGAFTVLGNQTNLINAGPQINVQSDVVIGAILDAAGWPVGQRTLDAGYVPVGNWFKVAANALAALQEIEELEQGDIYEGLAWDIIFENRYHRSNNTASTVSQATFSDAPNAQLPYLLGLAQSNPLQQLFNLITCQVNPYNTPAAIAPLWTYSGDAIRLSPGASITLTGTYSGGFVNPWTTPVVGTDITQTGVSNSDIAVSGVSKYATTMPFTITNNNVSTDAILTLVQARGIAVTPATPYQVSAMDAASQSPIGGYGVRSYPIQNPWHFNAAYAQAACDYFITLYKNPFQLFTVTIPSGTSDALFEQAVKRKISDRITLVANKQMTMMGVSGDFFIEAINHKIDFANRRPLETTWLVSQASALVASPSGRWFTLDQSRLDGADLLGY
jgi:hypothetical protein